MSKQWSWRLAYPQAARLEEFGRHIGMVNSSGDWVQVDSVADTLLANKTGAGSFVLLRTFVSYNNFTVVDDLQDLFIDFLRPTPEELVLFELEHGTKYPEWVRL